MKNETVHGTGRAGSCCDTETRILRAAAELFAARGFRGSTVRDIAVAAGLNEVTIYRYFPAKQELCRKAVDWKIRHAGVPECLIRPLTRADAPRRQLREFCMAALELLREEPALARLLYFTGLELDAHARTTVYINHLKPVVTALLIRLRAWIDAGEIRQLDPETAAIGILGVLLSQLQMRELVGPGIAGSSEKSLDRLSREYTDLCLWGLQSERGTTA